MAISLAPAALDRVRRYLAETPDALGLRFGVKRTGCSGWQYVADLAKDRGDDDRIFLQDDVRIYVDASSLPIVDGTEIDLVAQKLGEQFVFRNPNVRAECGCGESFTTQDDA
ncbi:HesB/IscA family protein [Lysobacter xanthus]